MEHDDTLPHQGAIEDPSDAFLAFDPKLKEAVAHGARMGHAEISPELQHHVGQNRPLPGAHLGHPVCKGEHRRPIGFFDSLHGLASTEGIFAEPTGVASLAGLIKLVEQGIVKGDESIVVLITGSGLKDPEAAISQFGKAPTIKPNVKEFEAVTRAIYGSL